MKHMSITHSHLIVQRTTAGRRQVETVDGRGTAVTVATATKESRGGDEKLSMDDPKSKLIDPPYRPVTLIFVPSENVRH